MRLVACLTMCLMPILANAAQTDAQAPSDPQAYCVNRSADFYPLQVSPAKAGINSDRAIAEKLMGAWLPCQQSSALQWPAQSNYRLNPEDFVKIQNP
jgi:hypothetical protein